MHHLKTSKPRVFLWKLCARMWCMNTEEAMIPVCVLGRYESYGSLSSEECGIVHGCENGRCIRVEEGYTCDCYDGYQLDITSMTCIGIPLFSYAGCSSLLLHSQTASPLGEETKDVCVWLLQMWTSVRMKTRWTALTLAAWTRRARTGVCVSGASSCPEDPTTASRLDRGLHLETY